MSADVYSPFITARLDEDEAGALLAERAAEAVGRGYTGDWDAHDLDDMTAVEAGQALDAFEDRHNPARVLRQVAAMRPILDEHSGPTVPSDDCYGGGDHECDACATCGTCTHRGPCPAVQALASIWSDHPEHPDNVA